MNDQVKAEKNSGGVAAESERQEHGLELEVEFAHDCGEDTCVCA